MVFKLLIAAALFVAFAEAQYLPWDYGEPISGNVNIAPPAHCNETVCHTPCEGAAPPKVCPANIPECPSGCACVMDCSTNTLTCFMTKHCTKIRRFLTKRRHARAASHDVDLPSSTGAMNKSLHVEQDVAASTVAQANSQRTGQNLPASYAAQGTSGRAKLEVPTAGASGGRVERGLPASTVTQAVSHSARKDISSPMDQIAGVRVERELLEPTVTTEQEASTAEYASFRAQHAVTLVQPVSIDYKRLEMEAEAKVKKAAEKSAEKSVEAAMKKKNPVKPKIANTGAGVVTDVAAGCVVLFTCFYRCVGSLLSGNL